MRRKISIILEIIIIVFLLTGCDGNVTRDIRHAGFSLSSNEFRCSTLMPSSEKYPPLDNIIYTNEVYAITEKGNLYELSLDKPYATDENCKKIDFSLNVIAYMDDKILKAEDNKFYYAPSVNTAKPLTEVTANDSNYQLYNLLLGNQNVKKVITVDSNAGIYYTLESDGNVYKYIITRQNYNSPYTIVSKAVIYEKEKYGEIIDFNYEGESTKTYIKTKTEIYRMQITNEIECNKYADIKCNYKMKKDETLSKYYNDKILYYGPSLLITTYGKEFTLNK